METEPDMLRIACKWIRRAFPMQCRVLVRRVTLDNPDDDDEGNAIETPKGFSITIADHLHPTSQVQSLFHEWSHIRTWDQWIRKEHPKAWQHEYGRISAAWEAYKGNP